MMNGSSDGERRDPFKSLLDFTSIHLTKPIDARYLVADPTIESAAAPIKIKTYPVA